MRKRFLLLIAGCVLGSAFDLEVRRPQRCGRGSWWSEEAGTIAEQTGSDARFGEASEKLMWGAQQMGNVSQELTRLARQQK